MMMLFKKMYRVSLFKVALGVKYCFICTVFFILCATARADSEKVTCEDCWSPNLEFDIENSGVEKTMIFISGYGYGLNNSNKVLIAKGLKNYFCNGGRIIDSEELIAILNENISGQVTAEQVSSVITFGLMKKYPCN